MTTYFFVHRVTHFKLDHTLPQMGRNYCRFLSASVQTMIRSPISNTTTCQSLHCLQSYPFSHFFNHLTQVIIMSSFVYIYFFIKYTFICVSVLLFLLFVNGPSMLYFVFLHPQSGWEAYRFALVCLSVCMYVSLSICNA